MRNTYIQVEMACHIIITIDTCYSSVFLIKRFILVHCESTTSRTRIRTRRVNKSPGSNN